jgi:hypothetical protein
VAPGDRDIGPGVDDLTQNRIGITAVNVHLHVRVARLELSNQLHYKEWSDCAYAQSSFDGIAVRPKQIYRLLLEVEEWYGDLVKRLAGATELQTT